MSSAESEIGLRRIYHHKAIRADGHLFISVNAYQLPTGAPYTPASSR